MLDRINLFFIIIETYRKDRANSWQEVYISEPVIATESDTEAHTDPQCSSAL